MLPTPAPVVLLGVDRVWRPEWYAPRMPRLRWEMGGARPAAAALAHGVLARSVLARGVRSAGRCVVARPGRGAAAGIGSS